VSLHNTTGRLLKIKEDIEKIERALTSLSSTEEKLSDVFKEISVILSETKNNLENLELKKKELEQERNQLSEQIEQLRKEKLEIKNAKESLEIEKQQLTEAKTTLEIESQEKEDKIGELSSKQKDLLKEYEVLKEELKTFQEIATAARRKEFDFEEIKNLLKIYGVLIKDIYDATAHYRILDLLHGDKEEMSKDDIKGATGITGAMVLHAIFDLRKANLITYDEEVGKAKLVRRIFAKENKK
jgi:chromosome segregation ATPase